jgi:hypothetical protein
MPICYGAGRAKGQAQLGQGLHHRNAANESGGGGNAGEGEGNAGWLGQLCSGDIGEKWRRGRRAMQCVRQEIHTGGQE